MKQRLRALEALSAWEGRVLTERQVAALERVQREQETRGEFESEYPEDGGAQDTLYLGPLKSVGRISQQTLIDTDSKVAFAKPYTEKTPITAADFLNDHVVPFFAEHDIPLSRILRQRCRSREKSTTPARASTPRISKAAFAAS